VTIYYYSYLITVYYCYYLIIVQLLLLNYFYLIILFCCFILRITIIYYSCNLLISFYIILFNFSYIILPFCSKIPKNLHVLHGIQSWLQKNSYVFLSSTDLNTSGALEVSEWLSKSGCGLNNICLFAALLLCYWQYTSLSEQKQHLSIATASNNYDYFTTKTNWVFISVIMVTRLAIEAQEHATMCMPKYSN